jgi:hypothetical protein
MPRDTLLWQKNKCLPRGNERKHSEHLISVVKTPRTAAVERATFLGWLGLALIM